MVMVGVKAFSMVTEAFFLKIMCSHVVRLWPRPLQPHPLQPRLWNLMKASGTSEDLQHVFCLFTLTSR